MALGHWGTTVLPGRIATQYRRTEVVWETIAPHPTVMAHPTSDHQKIRFLHPHKGVMLIGYGDWNDNLGPVDVIGYDLTSGQPVTLHTNVMTEAFDRIRIIDGAAYLPWVDAKTYAGNQGGFTTDRTGVWTDVKVGPGNSMLHTFDLAKIGGKIHVCGSRDATSIGEDYTPGTIGYGTVWREDAPGVWVEALRGAGRDAFARFHVFKAMPDGKVRVQNTAGGVETFETIDGESWYSVVDTAWTSTSTWGANSSDQPPARPTGYDATHGLTPVSAAAYHDGWVWVGGNGGVVKRALLPDAVVTPAPGATPAVNILKNPNTVGVWDGWAAWAGTGGGSAANTVLPAGGPDGGGHLRLSWDTPPTTGGGFTTGSPFLAVSPGDRLQISAWLRSSAPVGGQGVVLQVQWYSNNTPVNVGFEFPMTYGPQTPMVANEWEERWASVTVPAVSTTGLPVNQVQVRWYMGSHAAVPLPAGFTLDLAMGSVIAAAEKQPYFDGDTPTYFAYRYEWSGTPNASASFRKVRGAVPDDFASLFTETF